MGPLPSPFPKELDADRKGSIPKRFVQLCWSSLSSKFCDSSFLYQNSLLRYWRSSRIQSHPIFPLLPFPSYASPHPPPHQSIPISEKAPKPYLLVQVLPILHSLGPGPPVPRGCVYRKSKGSGIRNSGLETQLCHRSAVTLDHLPNLPEL